MSQSQRKQAPQSKSAPVAAPTSGTALESMTAFVKANSKFVRQATPVKQTLGAYEIVINDCSFKIRMDELAMEHSAVWRGQPRAHSIVQVFKDKKLIHEHDLSGFLKFTYGEKPMHVKQNFKPVKIVATSKENGEYMPVSFFTVDGSGFWVIGSKNVRIVVRQGFELEDIAKYSTMKSEEDDGEEKTEQRTDRFSFACAMAKHFFTAYKTKLDDVSKYLNDTKYTMNCESCRLDSQHLKKYETDSIFIFSFTKPLTDKDVGITALLPEESEAIALKLCLPSVTFKSALVSDSSAVNTMLDAITKEKNSEGSVIYLVGRDKNGTDAVIWTYKHKAEEYVFWRAVREVFRNNERSIRKTITKIAKLAGRFSSGEQKLSTIDLSEFVAIAHSFHAYWRLAVKDEFFAKWPVHMDAFNELPVEAKQKLVDDLAAKAKLEKDQFVVIIKGVPGSGKSTFGKTLATLLSQAGTSAEFLDQDMVGGNPRAYEAGIKQKLGAGVTALILGKSHHNKKTRADLYKVLPGDLTRVFVDFAHPSGIQAYQTLVTARINTRGQNHQSLVASTNGLAKIIDGFFKSMESLTKEETGESLVVTLDVSGKLTDWITKMFVAMNKTESVNFTPTNEQQTVAIQTVLADEKKIVSVKQPSPSAAKKEVKERRVQYYAVTFADTKPLLSHEVVLKLLTDHKIKPQAKHHITLKFFGGKGTAEEEAAFTALVGRKNLAITCYSIVSDDKGIAVLVKLPDGIPCVNEQAHITIGNAEGTKPVYSNTLIKTAVHMMFANPIMLNGEISAVY